MAWEALVLMTGGVKKKSACMQQCPNDRRGIALPTRSSCSCLRQSVHAEPLGEAKKLIQALVYYSSLAARDFFFTAQILFMLLRA